jgi:hypothetical protein
LRKGHDNLLIDGTGPWGVLQAWLNGTWNSCTVRPRQAGIVGDEAELQHQHLIDAALEGFFTQVRGMFTWC